MFRRGIVLINVMVFITVGLCAQSTLLSWPLTTDYTTVVYAGTDLDNGAYSPGAGIVEFDLAVDGGAWYNFTENNYIDPDDYIQMELTAATGGSPKNVYINSLEFSLKQVPWFTSDGPTKYEFYYSKNSDFSDPVFIKSGDITTNFTVEDVTFTSPLTVFTGESIYFRLYGYLSEGWGDLIIQDSQFFIKGYTENSPTINPVPFVSFEQNCDADGNLIFDLPSGFNAANETILIFAKANSAINTGASTALLSAYPMVDSNLNTFSGSSYEHDPSAKLVYKGTASGPQTLTAMTAGTDYYFIAFNFFNNGGTGNVSGACFGQGSVTGFVPDVTSFKGVGSNTFISLSFISPNCVDDVLIVAKEGTINAIPTGNGSSYIADSDYLGSGSNFDGGKVVYNTTHTSFSNGNVNVSNLINGSDYYFKSFVRKGTVWSAGNEIIASPNMAAIAFTQTQSLGSDFFEFITLERQDLSGYNITNQGVCESGAIYRSFTELEQEDFFNSTGNPDVTNPLTDVPAGTFVKVYTGNTTVDVDYDDGLISLPNSNLNLSSLGDQVMIYSDPIPGSFEDCGTTVNPIKAGINFSDANDWINMGIVTDNTSYRPQTSGAFATLDSRGRSRILNNISLTGDSATILAGLLTTTNWQHKNQSADWWNLKKILFNQSDYENGDIIFSNVSSNSFDLDASGVVFSDATRSTRYIVIVRDNAAPQDPVDRYSCYQVTNDYNTTDDVVRGVTINYGTGLPCGSSQTLGNGKVVYFGYDLPTNLTVNGLSGCTDYQVSIHAVNGNGVTSNYGTGHTNQLTTSTSGAPQSIIYSQQSGNFSSAIWDDITNGTANALPVLSPCLKIVIQNGHTVTMDINAAFGELDIESGAAFDLATFELSLQRDFIILGNLTSTTGKVVMNGSDGQQIVQTVGEIIFYDLEVDKGSPSESNLLLIDGDAAVSHLLTIVNGDLTIQTGNTMRLISDQADYAAALGPVPAASLINGNFVIERYLPTVSTTAPPGSGFGVGWRYLSAPILNASFSTWNDDFITTGLTNSNYPNYLSYGYYFPNLQFYTESIPGLQSNGFDGDAIGAAPTIRNRRDISQSVTSGKGVFAYLGPVPLNIDAEGTPFTGGLNVDVDYTSSAMPLEDGWNLIGNPYPSAIDWKRVNRSAGIGNFAYIYDTSVENFVVLDALASGDQLIASSNAFWVKTTQQGIISFEESNKSLDVTAPFYKNADEAFNELYIHIYNEGDSSLSDFTRIRFMEEASNEYDVLYDAPKRYSLNSNVPGLVTMIDSNDFAINSFSKNDSLIAIPLKAKIGVDGNYFFSFDIAGDYFNQVCLTLHDIQNDEYLAINNNGIYEFDADINQIEDENRFELIMSPTIEIESIAASCYGASNGAVNVSAFGLGPFQYIIYDAMGEEISNEISTNSMYSKDELEYGIYTIEVSGIDGLCESVTNEFFIAQPALSEEHSIGTYPTNCQGGYDGEISILLTDSLAYVIRLYAEGELLQEKASSIAENYFDHLYEGSYSVEIANACTSQWIDAEILSNDSMELDFELSAETIYLQDGGEVYCENTSQNASSYKWFFFADQDYDFTEEDGIFTYTQAGSYDIYLFAKSQLGCSRYISKTIEVVDLASSIEEFDSTNGVSQVRYSNDSFDLYFENIQSTKLSISLLNELGQELRSSTVNPEDGSCRIEKGNLNAGLYLIQLRTDSGYSQVLRVVID